MDGTLLLLGIACIIGAIVGGGLTAFGIKIPIINSLPRQMVLAVVGIILIAYSQGIPPFNLPPTPPTPTSTPSSLVIHADADKSWPVEEDFLIPESTEVPVNEKVLDLSSCSALTIGKACTDGLVAIRFNLADIPVGAKINKAILKLYAHGRRHIQIHVQRAISPWQEDQPTRPDCDTAEKLTIERAYEGWNQWDVTAIVQNQVATSVNYGFCIRIDANGQIAFASREDIGTTMPYLETTYQP